MTNHTLLLNIMARLQPPLPCIPRLPMAGDTVTYRLRGNLHTARVLGVGVGDFDEPEFYLDSKVKVLRYAITGVMVQEMVA